MGFLGLVRRKGLFGVTWGTPGADTWPGSLAWSRGDIQLGAGEKLKDPFGKHSTLTTALCIFLDDSLSVGWEAYAPDHSEDDDPIDRHPVLDLFKKPSPVMTAHQFFWATYLSRRLFGAFAWYYPDLVIGKRGGLKATQGVTGQILLLDPRRMFRKADGWYLKVFDGEMKLDERCLTICARWSPYEPFKWVSEIDAVLMEVEADHAAAGMNLTLFRDQKGVPTGLLVPSIERDTPYDERKDFTERLNQEANARRRFALMIPPGWDWKALNLTARDMEFRSLREYARELILAAVGVPPFMAGVLDKANYANAREQKAGYWEGPQTRFLTEVQSTLNSDFLPKIGVTDIELYPCWEKVKALLENLAEKVDVAGKLFAMGFTKRQINQRLELGMEVDDLEDADVGYLPFNVLPVEQVLDPPEPPPALPLPGDGGADGAGNPPKMLALRAGQESRRALIWRGLMARTRDLEVRFNQAIRRHMREIEDVVLGNVDGIKGWQATQRAMPERKDAAGQLLFDLQEMARKLIQQTAPLHKAGVKRGGESVLSDLGSSAEFNMLDPRVVAKLAELSHKITRIDVTIEAALRESLAEGLSAGESVNQLAARVRQVMDASKARSMTIARTETGFAFNTGRNESMKQAGVSRHEWLTARDPRVRDSHEAEDGKVAVIGEPFPTTHLLYPLDPSGPPDQTVNCRCVAVPVVAEV